MKERIESKYRKDIDGLRAIAVIFAVLFHAYPKLLPGGFIGVDIFFVISGFLISTILLESLSQNSFSFVDFYSRRICRIFPALILVFLFSLVLGWNTLFADEYALLGKHIFSSGGFYQNFNLLTEAGYFDEAGENKPLMHLWSLGIEEQFYLVWPLLLWIGYKLKINPFILIFTLGLGSFILNLIYINANQIIAFFSPYTRMWELLIGAALAWYQLNSRANFLFKDCSLVGFVLIVLGLITISSVSPFPGWPALLPTLGTFFIIAAGPNGAFNRTILSNKIMVGLGLISYPLYLWHWVLLSYFNIIESGELMLEIRGLLLVASLLLSIVTYLFVERFFRHNSASRIKALLLIFLMLLVSFVGFNIYKRDGLSFRSTSLQNLNEIFINYLKEENFSLLEGFTCKKVNDECELLSSNKKRVLLWGDSHAQMLTSGLKTALPDSLELILIASPGCRPSIIRDTKTLNECEIVNSFALDQIRKSPPDFVLLAQRDAWDPQAVNSLYENLIMAGVKKVLFLGKTPEWTAALPKIIYRKKWHTIPRYTKAHLNFEALNLDNIAKGQFQETPQKQFIDLIGYLCNEEGCLVYIGDDLATGITSYDDNHLSRRAAEYVSKGLIANYLK